MNMALEHRRDVFEHDQQQHGVAVAAVLRAFMAELGIDERSPEANRAAMRVVFRAQRALGHDEGDPDQEAGPPLSAAELAKIKRPRRRSR